MKRLRCWFSGHDFYSYELVGQYVTVQVVRCSRCGITS